MKILIINNRGQYNHRIQRSLQNLDIPCELVPNSLTVEEIKEKEPMGLILGGGPSLTMSGNCLDYISEINVPILGICLGHQLIAQKFGGDVETSKTESYAQVQININDEEELLKGLAPTMDVWTSHKDEVKKLPENFKILASSNICDIEAMKHNTKDIYGIQFHPEVHTTPKGDIVFQNFYEICKNNLNK
ncbi:GMP synthase [Methanobrevibacter sp. 87.7]|uniref:GMP synthase subunit A n=1 Tax=Methanobrevibacter sp. 87.7 TaxID=387957 RepID=UPI000B5020B2|nr:GMP synthase subunit A [Methanobrevibacter sp. 87.7]OWT33052.1 GMP synthase [Methanobrevibacter sp. 87.7]